MMKLAPELAVPKWPFFLGDALMLGIAGFIAYQGRLPLTLGEVVACGTCVALGALLGILPFLLEHKSALKQLEIAALGAVSEKFQHLETVAAQISHATNHWNTAQEQAEKTTAAAREIADRMAAEVREFGEFMRKMNDGEKATLRLEVEKLRRAEGDWLQVLVHILDHVFALHAAAARTGQTGLINQLASFQHACRDAARRIGLIPLLAAPGDLFDSQRHQLPEGEAPPAGTPIIETLATGYSFQGRQLRPVIVRVEPGEPRPEAAPETSPVAESQLTLETGQS